MDDEKRLINGYHQFHCNEYKSHTRTRDIIHLICECVNKQL